MTIAVPRNRSLKFQDHEGLIHKLAKKYHARLLAAQIPSINFDDVIGELSLAFVRAAKGYNPDAGWTFTAFLERCCQNHFNKLAKRLMLEHFGTESAGDLEEGKVSHRGLGTISVEDIMGAQHDGDQADMQFLDLIECDKFAAPGDRLDAEMTLKAIVADDSLSAETRVYITMIANPAMQVSEGVKGRIRRRTAVIRRELTARYGIEMGHISV